MLEDQLLEEFSCQLRDETLEKLAEIGTDIPLAEDAAFTDVVLGYLEEAGLVSEHALCPHEDRYGRNRCRIIAYSLPEDDGRLDLFTSAFVQENQKSTVTNDDLGRLTGWAARFFRYAILGETERFSGNQAALDAARLIAEERDRIEEVRIHVLTNGAVKDRLVDDLNIEGRPVEFFIFDLDRLSRISRSTVTRDRIEIDFERMLGRPIACLGMQAKASEYETFLLVLPGNLISDLYDEYGARLFEFNVRSFLQAKGKVNKGLRDTLRHEPERFLAYNNGITATADEIEVGTFMGETVIKRVKGLQIVNGAQTTASIHRARKIDKISVDNVAVSMKLTRVQPDKLAEFVPLIARYANTQNVIQVSDLSANNHFHIRIEQLSEQVWCPGEESRWLYERARGAYQVAKARYGTTLARRREFERECPKAQHFSKTDLAKYLTSWWQRPQTVSRGAQKNFAIFMAELPERFPEDWDADEEFYRSLVSLAIIYRTAQTVVRKARLQSYGANVIAYMVARASHDLGSRIDLETIWESQEVSEKFREMFIDWAPRIHEALIETAGRRNVTEWCKKEECWDKLKVTPLPIPGTLPEIASEKRAASKRTESFVNSPHTDLVSLCCSYDRADWAKVIAWAATSDKVTEFEQQVSSTLLNYALGGWRRRPSEKQANVGVKVLQAAAKEGIVSL